jgi:hypothetical protein
MEERIEKAKRFFLKRISKFGSDPYNLLPHVPEAEKWAKFMLKKYPAANREVILLAVWLHDVGHYPIDETDHAIKGEDIAKKFLTKEQVNPEIIKQVLHCIRAHRCKEVLPATLEAKIIAFIDSASHMTGSIYLDMFKSKSLEEKGKVFGKMERDFRDLSYFPEIKDQMKELYESWKILLKSYGKTGLEF